MQESHRPSARLEFVLELRLPRPQRHAALIAQWLRRVAQVIERGDPPSTPPAAPAAPAAAATATAPGGEVAG